jgi:hypothetical protein
MEQSRRALASEIRSTLKRVRNARDTLDAYRAASIILGRHWKANVALEDIVDELLRGAQGIPAIDLEPAALQVILV